MTFLCTSMAFGNHALKPVKISKIEVGQIFETL
jgi:hypothetical protein